MKRILSTLKEKWPEYLLEILVLIIGIYGAFALESWNQERIDSNKEIEYLDQINKEFKKNKEQFEYVVANNSNSLKSCYQFLAEYEKNKPNPDSILIYWKRLLNTWVFNPSQSSINSLVNSSSIDVIRNEELKLMLLSWNDLILDYSEEEQLTLGHVVNDIIPYVEENLDLQKWNNEKENTKLDLGLKNRIIMRVFYLTNIFENDQHEMEKVRESINKIIELTEQK